MKKSRTICMVAVTAIIISSYSGCGFLDAIPLEDEDELVEIETLTREQMEEEEAARREEAGDLQGTGDLQEGGHANETSGNEQGADNSSTSENQSNPADTNIDPSEMACSFTCEDLAGNTVDQMIFTKTNMTVVNIWATFCGPCLQEMPELQRFAENYTDKGVQVVGICVDIYDDRSLSYANQIIEENGITYTNLVVSDSVNDWYTGSVQYVPTTIVADSKGNILSEKVGGMSYEEFENLVK